MTQSVPFRRTRRPITVWSERPTVRPGSLLCDAGLNLELGQRIERLGFHQLHELQRGGMRAWYQLDRQHAPRGLDEACQRFGDGRGIRIGDRRRRASRPDLVGDGAPGIVGTDILGAGISCRALVRASAGCRLAASWPGARQSAAARGGARHRRRLSPRRAYGLAGHDRIGTGRHLAVRAVIVVVVGVVRIEHRGDRARVDVG